MKVLLIGLLLLGSVSAFADIRIYENDTFVLRVMKDIHIPIDTTLTKIGRDLSEVLDDIHIPIDKKLTTIQRDLSENTCKVLTSYERFDRVIKAGKTLTFSVVYLSEGGIAGSFVGGKNQNKNSDIKGIIFNIREDKKAFLSKFNSLARSCYLEVIEYNTGSHEGNSEIE